MRTKTGKEVKIPCLNKNIKCLSGTVENYKSPKSIYIYISTWIEPKKTGNYDKIISLFERNIKSFIRENNLIDDKIFDEFYILDLDLRESGIKLGKKSFMSLELNLYQKNNSILLPLKSNKNEDDLIPYITKLVNDIITSDLFIKNEHFEFYLTKRLKTKLNNMKTTEVNYDTEKTTLQIPSEEELIREKTLQIEIPITPYIKKPIPPPTQSIKEGQDPKSVITNNPIPIGWECPRCHKIHSPYSLNCDCPPKLEVINSDKTSIKRIF